MTHQRCHRRTNTIAHLVDVVTSSAGKVPVLADPVLLYLHLPTTLQYRVARELAHVGRGQLVDLSDVSLAATLIKVTNLGCTAVLFK